MNKTQGAVTQDEVSVARGDEARRIIRKIFIEVGIEPDAAEKVELDIRPGETRAEAALRALQEGFASSGVREEEMQEEALKIREELYREYYGGE